MHTLHKLIGEHQRFEQKGRDEQSVPRYFLQMHNKNVGCLEVMAIETILKSTLTDSERFSLLCRREDFWIYNFSSLSPNGLNEDLDIHNVLEVLCL